FPSSTALVEFPSSFQEVLEEFADCLARLDLPPRDRSPFLLQRVLLETDGMAERRLLGHGGKHAAALLGQARAKLETQGIKLISLEAKTRYAAIRTLLDGVRHAP